MENKQFSQYNCDLQTLQKRIEIHFVGKGYKVTNFHKNTTFLTQAYKREMGNKAIHIAITGTPANFNVSIGLGDKITSIQNFQTNIGNIPMSTKLLVGEPTLERSFWNFVTTQADLRRNTFGRAMSHSSNFSPVWREREIVKEIEVMYCTYCGEKNNARLTNCTNCGSRLH